MAARRVRPGDRLAPRRLASLPAGLVDHPDPDRLIHLQFRRFAGCPVCNLHLRSIARRHGEILAAGVREVVVYRSPAAALREHVAQLPFEVVADPGGVLHAELGVGRSLRAVADPRAWGAIVQGAVLGLGGRLAQGEDALTLPADFLVDREGRVVACKYGVHADDQWSVDEILARAKSTAASGGDPMPAIETDVPRPGARLVYWAATTVAAVAFMAPGIANLTRASHIVADMMHLGYPPYFPSILGAWKVLGAATIMAPRLPRLKEWAYAGMIFDLTGAAASRALTGDGLATIAIPLLIAAVVLASWLQRPASRRLAAAPSR